MVDHMIEVRGDLWEIPADARVVTTNGIVMKDGRLIMGGGCALEAAQRYPDMPMRLGALVAHYGNHSFVMEEEDNLIISMPTKNHVRDPSDPDLIVQSAKEMVIHANEYHLNRILVPRPGCGLGGLDWEDVRNLLWPIFDGRFYIVTW